MAVRYGTPQFLRRDTIRWYGMLFLWWYGYGTLVRYAIFVMVRVRYVGTWFELKIPDFSHIAPAFCMQRQKTDKAEVKCVNWDRWFIGKWFQSQLKLRVVKSKDGCTVRYVCTVWYASIFAKKYGSLVRYAFFVMVRVRYVGTVRFKKWTEVRYGWRCEVRSTQILNVP